MSYSDVITATTIFSIDTIFLVYFMTLAIGGGLAIAGSAVVSIRRWFFFATPVPVPVWGACRCSDGAAIVDRTQRG